MTILYVFTLNHNLLSVVEIIIVYFVVTLRKTYCSVDAVPVLWEKENFLKQFCMFFIYINQSKKEKKLHSSIQTVAKAANTAKMYVS